jgi:hypothetical protein
MNQDEFVIFAELKREKFEEILQTLQSHFDNIQFGRQGDDWIWVHFSDEKIEIDSFYSMNLEVKGKRKLYSIAKEILSRLDKDCILEVFDPPKVDLTR